MKKIVLFISVLFLAACGNDEVEVNGSKMEYEELLAKIEESKSDLTEIEENKSTAEKELSKITDNLNENKKEFEDLKDLQKNRNAVTSKVAEAEKKLGLLELDIEEAETELKALKGEIVVAADDPLSIGAGFYYFGSDIPEGRYKVMPQKGHRGNLFVKDSTGSSFVNTILAEADGYNSEFLFTGMEGDVLEATMPVLLYPAE